jgi:hypothetical protein
LLLAIALVTLAGCARPRNDAQIASEVQQKIYSDSGIHTRQITVQSNRGVVTLFGSAANNVERFAAAADAATVDGVKTVVNNLEIPQPQQARAIAPSSPQAVSEVPAAPSKPAGPLESSGVSAAQQLSSASHNKPMVGQVNGAAARRKAAKRNDVKKSSSLRGTQIAANDSSGLPYSTAAPPSSPVGASQPIPKPAAPVNAPPVKPAMPTAVAASSSPTQPAPASSTAKTAPVAALPAAPAKTPPVAALPAAPPKPVTIPTGTSIAVRLLDRIDSEKNHAGDSFRATLDTPLIDEAGATVIPAGYEVTGSIVDAKSAGRFAGNSALALELTRLSVNGKQYSLRTNQYTRRGKSRGRSTAEKVGGGAALGAILGGIFGGAKGAAIGATVGAGAGTGVSAAGKGEQIVLPVETALNFELQEPLSVTPTTQSPHGRAQEQSSVSTTDESTMSSASASTSTGDDGPPVLKRRPH